MPGTATKRTAPNPSDAAVQAVLAERTTVASRRQHARGVNEGNVDDGAVCTQTAGTGTATMAAVGSGAHAPPTCQSLGQQRVLHVEQQLRQLKFERSRRNPRAVVQQGSRHQHDIDIERDVGLLLQQQQRPMTSSVLGGSYPSNSSFFAASLPANNRGSSSRGTTATTTATVGNPRRAMLPPVNAQRPPLGHTRPSATSTTYASGDPQCSPSSDDAAAQPSYDAVLEVIAHQLSATDEPVKDFSCLTFDDTSYQVLLSSLATLHGVATLNLQYVTVPFGEEGRLLDVLVSNPTPITDVELYCSCFMAYPQLVEQMESILTRNRGQAAAHAQRSAAETARLRDKERARWLHERSTALLAHAKKLIGGVRDDEVAAWHRIMEGWSLVCAYTKQRDWDRAISLANRASRTAVRDNERRARGGIEGHEQHAFHVLVVNAWALSRDATLGEEKERRRSIWSAYCESWTRASVSTKRRQAQCTVELRALEVVALRGRQAMCAEEATARQALRALAIADSDAMAAVRHDARLKKDDDHRRFRQRHAEEEIALEQQRAKARMENMMHNGNGEPSDGPPKSSASTSMRIKPFRLGDEDAFFRFMTEISTQLFEAMATIRKLTERCVLREGKLRDATLKYQRALALPPRLWTRVSADAPPTVLYDGQQHPLTIEPTLSVGLAMDSFWTVRCELLRDELQKLQQPYRQSRKECAQQLYPVMQDVDRWYRMAGLSGHLAWPGHIKAAYVTNSSQPSKELFDHIERTTLQSVKRLRLSKETIVCGVLHVELPEAVRPFGGLAVDERALLAFRDLKPHLFNCSKPISMWDCTYEGVRTDIPVPEALRVDPQVMLATTVNAAVTKREDLFPVEATTPLPSHRSRGGSCPASARPGGGSLKPSQPSPIQDRPASQRGGATMEDSSPTDGVDTCTASETTLTPIPQLPTQSDDLPEITTTSPPLRSPLSDAAAMPPIRSPHAAAAIDLTIPTGVTPEQIEAFAKCIKFIPVQRVDPVTGQCGGGAITELLGPHGATLGSVRVRLVLHTKGIRQRHLPLTNLGQYTQDRSSTLLAARGSSDMGSSKASSPAMGRMASMRRDFSAAPPTPAAVVPPLPTAVASPTADTITSPVVPQVRRLNPLKALSIVKTEAVVSLSFLIAPSIITCSTPLHSVTHDARGGPCPLLPKRLFQLYKPPAVVRNRNNPFKLKIVHNKGNGELLAASTLTDTTTTTVASTSAEGNVAGLASRRAGSQSLLGRPTGLHTMATGVFGGVGDDADDGGQSMAVGGIVDGDAPFRGLTLTVRLHQFAQMSAEDLAVVESSNVVVAKRGRVYYLPSGEGEGDDDGEEDDGNGSTSTTRAASGAAEADEGMQPFEPMDPFLNMTTLSKPDTPPLPTNVTTQDEQGRAAGRADSFDNGGDSLPNRSRVDSSAFGLSTCNCLAEQIASYEQPPQELRVSFLSDEYVTMARVQRTLRAIAYRNASVDPTTGPRKMTVTIASPAAGVSESMEVVVNVTALDDPTDWAVHNAHRVVHFPLDATHAREWISSLETTDGMTHADAAAMLDRLVPPAVVRFADAVEVLDDDTTFFSAGHLRFALFEGRDDVPLGGRQADGSSECLEGAATSAQSASLADDDTFVLASTAALSQSGFGKLNSVGAPCRDDGVGLFLDVPMYRTLFGLCLVEQGDSASAGGVSQHHADTGESGGTVFDLFDDGYLQGTVRMGADRFGTVTRRYASQPAPPAMGKEQHQLHCQAHASLALAEAADMLDGAAEARHGTCVHALVNTIHVEFAKGGNGATVDAVQELLKLVSFVNLKRFPTTPSDTATRLATIDMLVGATTGRRDILGALLDDTNVNHPLHAVVAVAPRASFLKPTPNECRPLAPRHYPENSGHMFLFDEAFSIPHSFVGGYLRVELVEGFSESLDRVDCVDRTEAIAFQERERDDHRRKMAAGSKGAHGGEDANANSSCDGNSASTSMRLAGGGGGDITLSFDLPSQCVAAASGATSSSGAFAHATTVGGGCGDPATQQPSSMLAAPSAFAAFQPGTRYGAVRLVQNHIPEQFGGDAVAVARAAHVTASARTLAAYSMKEFAKVNMLSSSAETVAARNTSGDVGGPMAMNSVLHRPSQTGGGGNTSPAALDLLVGSMSLSSRPTAAANELPTTPDAACVDSARSRSSSLQPFSRRPSHQQQQVDPLASSSSNTPMVCSFLPTNASFFESIAPPAPAAVLGCDDANGHRRGSLTFGNGSPLGGTRRRRRSSVAIDAGTDAASSPIAAASARSVDDDAELADDSDDGDAVADAPVAPPSVSDGANSPMQQHMHHHRQRRGSHRSRSVVFQRDSLLEAAHARFDDAELLGRSVINPVLHTTLLAASSRRRSSMVHQQQLQRGGSRSASTINVRRQSGADSYGNSGKAGGPKRRSISSIGRSAQELVWANRLKKILMERSDSFMFLLKKSCARLIADRLEHLEYLGVDERFVVPPVAVPVASPTPPTYLEPPVSVHALTAATARSSATSTPLGAEIATTFCHRASGSLVVIFEPTTVITPSTLAAITRTIGFESRSRCTIQPLRMLRLTLRMYEVGSASLLVPLRVDPFDDPAEVTLRMPCLRWRHRCTAITPIVRQYMGKGGGGGGASSKASGKAGGGGKKGVTALATQSAAVLAMQSPPLCKDGLGAIRLFPKENSIITDVDTTHWDGGAVEVTITHGGTRGDCLCLLTVEQQKTLRRIVRSTDDGGSYGGGGGAATSRQAAGGGAMSARGNAAVTPPRTPMVTPSPQVLDAGGGGGGHVGGAMLMLSARSHMEASATSTHGASVDATPQPADDPTNEWLLSADPPFPTPSTTHIDPSQHALVEANETVHSAVLEQPRQLSVLRASDGAVLLANIGTVTVERALQRDVGNPAIDLERSKLAASTSVSGGGDGAPTPRMPPGNVVTMLRVAFATPPDDDPYACRITLDVLRLVVHNIGFFNVVPLDSERVIKSATIAIHDAVSPEPPARQTVSIECLPSYFFKPLLQCEPTLYTQRAAIEGRFEFILQRLKTMCCSNDRDKMPHCAIEVLPVSGWLPRDTLMLRFSGSPYVLTQDGQVICGKELVCKHTVATANGIRTEVTKECKGATWPKVAGLLALVSYHFDMKDFGKDAPTAPPPPQQQPAVGQTPGAQQPAAAIPASSPNTVPSHDRVVALQISEPGVRDAEGRLEQWCMLQRISYTSGISSDQ